MNWGQIERWGAIIIIIMATCYSIAILRTPEELRGGVYTRFMEIQAETAKLKDLIIEHDKEFNQKIEVLRVMINSFPDICNDKKRPFKNNKQ